ncbi:MAG: response regulator [Myxococcota bacterium]
MLKFVTGALERRGHCVTAAAGPGEALLVAEQELADIDLVVCDVMMPRLAGPQLVDRLRKKRRHLPAVFITGFTDQQVRTSDGDRIIRKPIAPSILHQTIEEVLTA